MKSKQYMTLCLAVAGLCVTSACNNTAEGMREDTANARAEMRQEAAEARADAAEARDDAARTADDAGNAFERAADSVGDAAKTAGRETEDAMRDTGRAVDGALKTFDVKAALVSDDRVDASHIDVDTNRDDRVVTLKGSVPSAAQRTVAAEIATKNATGYKIVNQLVVKG